jgi:hypothetical protein
MGSGQVGVDVLAKPQIPAHNHGGIRRTAPHGVLASWHSSCAASSLESGRQQVDVGMPVAIVSPQPANAEGAWREHSKGTWQFSTVLIDGRSHNLCLTHGRLTRQPDKEDARCDSTLTKHQLAKVLICRQEHICPLIGLV